MLKFDPIIVHGGDISGFSKKIGKPEALIKDFSSNINPLGPSKCVEKIYYESFALLKKYPDPQARELTQVIAEKLLLTTDNIIVGNGAIALIELAIRAINPRKVLLVEPCFTEYRRLAILNGAQIDSIGLNPQEDFQFSLEAIMDRLDQTDLIILGHPNNPTGTHLSQEDLLKLIQKVEEQNEFLLIDEAFIDWCPDQSVVDALKDYSSFLVIRSLTKYFSLAGIRIGYAAGAGFLIAKMKGLQETWSCNALAQKLGITALKDQEFYDQTQAWFMTESSRFFNLLSNLPGVKAYSSKANFFLLKVSSHFNPEDFWMRIKREGIYLRDTFDFQGLDASYVRIALLKEEDNNIFIKTLEECLVSYGAFHSLSG
ncbi:L-threonine 3-O-phosphate decarboxylase [hydrothermal vent metagenome]|uniref:L-threonine 3-O-phosphate decarboxylase n=1 Tax=hydrothermal vent metagenome TaxID=652676 RepID=A0A3B1DG27_9ZZZZ